MLKIPRFLLVWLLCFGWAGVAFADAVDAESPSAPQPLTPSKLDRLVLEGIEGAGQLVTIDDEQFLRRATLDAIGRQPTPAEFEAFYADDAGERRGRAVDRLLDSEEYGRNWANYWSDVISYRTPPPELTFLEYGPFKQWLAERLNANAPWDQIVREILTATGKVKDQPPVTFVAYHEGNPVRLASETARIFLGVQIQCAECHDHPFDDWKRDQFHHLAAYFARTSVKMPWNDGVETVVKDKGKGEYRMPNAADPTRKGKVMDPAFLDGEAFEKGKSDLERRTALADEVANLDNPWLAQNYVNRIWARLMGRGFYDPVDNISELQVQFLPEVHAALTESFGATDGDTKAMVRLIMNSAAYQRGLPGDTAVAQKPFANARAMRLRGDEVYQSLVTAIDLPNITPPKVEPTKAIRFPPPPKSTRDIVAETFGFDPSLSPADVSRTMHQAMLLMNNEQLQAQIDADPQSDTVLSRLLAEEDDNEAAFEHLFQIVLARRPTDKELQIALGHLENVPTREAAFEDLLWSLLNSTEFTTKR